MYLRAVTRRVVPHHDDEFVWMLFLEFDQECVCRLAVEAVDAGKVKTAARERRDGREEIAVVERLLTVDHGTLADFRPASSEVRDEAVAHLVAEVELEQFFLQRLHERYEAPFLNVSCLSLFPCIGCGRADLYE